MSILQSNTSEYNETNINYLPNEKQTMIVKKIESSFNIN